MLLADSQPEGFEALAGAEVFNHEHLPVAAAYCRRLGLVKLVNRLVPSKMELLPGLVVQAMVLDIFSGRSPLYRLENFFKDKDIELLLGEKVQAHSFNDSNVGRSLDAIYEAGPSRILTELGVAATSIFRLDASVVSYDTTSNSVWGDYTTCEAEIPPRGPVITHGHSKDHHPELKQFMTELLCVERGVPIFGRTLNGNSSDKTSNNELLSKLGPLMSKHGMGPGAFVYVADSAMVTEKNLIELIMTLFISRLPANYKECGRVIAEAVKADKWIDIGSLAEDATSKSRPPAMYKAFETTVELHGKGYRALVVHSSSHDKRRQKKLEKDIAKSAKRVENDLRRQTTSYSCEADAMAATKQAEKLSGGLHTVSASVRMVETLRPGRPPSDGPAPTNKRYVLDFETREDAAAIEREKTHAGCFVLISNVPSVGDNSLCAKGLLLTYKGQYGVESGFAFLKDPLVVNDLFLKTPARIDALGMILIIALMVWRLMERSMRAHVKNTDRTLPGWDNRETKKPTSFMMMHAITNIVVMVLGGKRHMVGGIGKRPAAFLEALGLEHDVFTNPQCQCIPIIPRKAQQNR